MDDTSLNGNERKAVLLVEPKTDAILVLQQDDAVWLSGLGPAPAPLSVLSVEPDPAALSEFPLTAYGRAFVVRYLQAPRVVPPGSLLLGFLRPRFNIHSTRGYLR